MTTVVAIPQTQNLALQSEDLSAAAWNVSSEISVTANDVTAPDGPATADRLTATAANSRHYVGHAFTIASPYNRSPRIMCMSVFVQRRNADWFAFLDERHTDFVYAWFNLSTGAVGSTTADNATAQILDTKIEAASNWISGAAATWWRCWMVYRMRSPGGGGGANAQCIAFGPTSADATQVYAGAGESCWAWGAQLTASANWPGPYRPTTAVQVSTGTLRQNLNYASAP